MEFGIKQQQQQYQQHSSLHKPTSPLNNSLHITLTTLIHINMLPAVIDVPSLDVPLLQSMGSTFTHHDENDVSPTGSEVLALDGPLIEPVDSTFRFHEQTAKSFVPQPNYLPLTYVAAAVQRPNSGATKLRRMLFETNELIVCPGVYDGLSARTAIEVGFDAMYMVSEQTRLVIDVYADRCSHTDWCRHHRVPSGTA